MLRSEFGMSAREAWDETPSWEIAELLSERQDVISKQEANQ